MDSEEQLETTTNQNKGVEYMATVTTQKWGNSLGIRIPKEVADRIGISRGSEMALNVIDNKKITLTPKKVQKKYTLDELLAQITPENRHEEIDFGTKGRELL